MGSLRRGRISYEIAFINTNRNSITKQKYRVLNLPKLTYSSTQTTQQRRGFTQNRDRNYYYAKNAPHIYMLVIICKLLSCH